MCGIAGFFDPDRRIDPGRYDAIALAMADRIAHRGPDDRGAWCDPAAGIALGFRRLSILDLSPAGSQPMHSADGRIVIGVQRRDLQSPRSAPRTRSRRRAPVARPQRQRVLVEAIARWGVVAHARARQRPCFAIAAWDRPARRLMHWRATGLARSARLWLIGGVFFVWIGAYGVAGPSRLERRVGSRRARALPAARLGPGAVDGLRRP